MKSNTYSLALITLTLLLGLTSLRAQTGRVVAANQAEAASPTIQLKWFSEELYSESGVYLYRREKGIAAWTKLTDSPLKKGIAPIAKELLAQDKTLKPMVDLVNKTPASQLEGLVRISVLVKAIQSAAFARFAGLQYDDTQVVPGKTYEYQVTTLKGGKETLLGMSAAIVAGDFVPADAPTGILIKPGANQTEITWKPEENRFYAVNIYRKSSTNSTHIQVNTYPLIISKIKDDSGKKAYPAVFFADDSLRNGVTYTYELAGVDFFGQETRHSYPIAVFVKDLIPPPAPEKLAHTLHVQHVALRWERKEAVDLAGFHVYRSVTSDDSYQRINSALLPVSTLAYTDTVARPHGYYYYVSSVDESQNETPSAKIFVDVKDVVPPARPQQVVIRADTGRIVLEWTSNTESDLKGYLIYKTIQKNTQQNFVLMNANPIKANHFEEKLPTNARNAFLYKVVAIDSAYNKSEFSEVALARLPDVTPPVPPFLKNIVARENALMLEWLLNVEPDLKGYTLYRAAEPDTNRYVALHPTLLSVNATSYTDASIQPGIRYYYRLTAVDSAGNVSLHSHRYTARSVSNATLAVRPENAKAVYSKQKKAITVSWNMKSADQLMGFVLYRRMDSQPFVPLTGMLAEKTYVDKDLQKGKTYSYEIRAYHQSGSVARSPVVQAAISE